MEIKLFPVDCWHKDYWGKIYNLPEARLCIRVGWCGFGVEVWWNGIELRIGPVRIAASPSGVCFMKMPYIEPFE